MYSEHIILTSLLAFSLLRAHFVSCVAVIIGLAQGFRDSTKRKGKAKRQPITSHHQSLGWRSRGEVRSKAPSTTSGALWFYPGARNPGDRAAKRLTPATLGTTTDLSPSTTVHACMPVKIFFCVRYGPYFDDKEHC